MSSLYRKYSTSAFSLQFQAAEHLASRLSMSLGVGKLNDSRLAQALVNFMQEGIRFSFEGDSNVDDDLVLGSRLPFLMILSKYSTWMKKSRENREILAGALFAKETELRSHPEFDEVHEDDLRCILEFKQSLGIAITKPTERQSTQNTIGGAGMQFVQSYPRVLGHP